MQCDEITLFSFVSYVVLSSTLPEIDPDTAYVICISVSLGFRKKKQVIRHYFL